jgi:hypothetical protein
MALKTQILPSGRLKRRLRRSRWRDVWRCRWANRNHFLHLGIWKKGLSLCRLSEVLNRRIALTLTICLLHVLKDDFDEVDEAMFQCVERPCLPIFWTSGFEKVTFWSRLSYVLNGRMPWELHILHLHDLKTTFLKTIKRCLKMSKCYAKSFSASRESKKELP